MSRIVHLHGLESTVDADGVPIGGKARVLRAHFGEDVALVPLDTSAAVRIAYASVAARGNWTYPFEAYEEAFATPLQRARAAITPQTRVLIGSSFGGAVLLRLLHEEPFWRGPSVFLAGAGLKLTPHRILPPGVPTLLLHGRRDAVVPFEDSERLAQSSESATLMPLDEGHTLPSILDGALVRAAQWGLDQAEGVLPSGL